MPQYKPDDSKRNCWGSAREKARLKARFVIRQRIVDEQHEATNSENLDTATTTHESQDMVQVQHRLQRVVENDRSFFSVTNMEQHANLYSTPIDTAWLYETSSNENGGDDDRSRFLLVGHEKLVSWFGFDGIAAIQNDLSKLSTITLIEFALLYQRYGIVSSLLLGGVSPCTRGRCRSTNDKESQDVLKQWEVKSVEIGRRILRMFFQPIPPSLQTYILKRVFDFRRQSWNIDGKEEELYRCCLCQEETPRSYLLLYDAPCCHIFCEPCFWEDVLKSLHTRQGDVVQCPVCQEQNEANLQTKEAAEKILRSPLDRYNASRQRFFELPRDTSQLRSKGKKRGQNKKKQAMASTWLQAVSHHLGSNQDNRMQKFFGFVERGDAHYVRGCLEAGVDLSLKNEYGQSGLYIASWRGHLQVVDLLLEYGCDPDIEANDGSNCLYAAKQNGFEEILSILSKYTQAKCSNESRGFHAVSHNGNPDKLEIKVETLIPLTSKHAGAGSYTIDNVLTTAEIEYLLELWEKLPTETLSGSKKHKLCSVRSYYCDVDRFVTRIILRALHQSENMNWDWQHSIVLPYMRFLSYDKAGISLAPHVDLFRADFESGTRSTHSWLLYLTECENGGETVLLNELSGSGPANMLAWVKPKQGRLLLFPHSCPHQGATVEDVPKLLMRGEVVLKERGE